MRTPGRRGFSKFQFVAIARDTNSFQGKTWTKSAHDLDMIIEKDGIRYGIEIKNTLGYIEKTEFDLKIEMCKWLGIKPLFVVRMLPKNWIFQLIEVGGFALILKYQLYPEILVETVKAMRNFLQLPVDCPNRLRDGTIQRFVNWHKKHVK